MNDRDTWKADHYREELFQAQTNLKVFQNYITFLEEKYRIRKFADFKEEFYEWYNEKLRKNAQQKS